ncbi:MAG: YegP family protein, partial [Syntrophomonadaceae bacterium]|nr:YegP family protein [Syntrophomonadaceae bacterium]
KYGRKAKFEVSRDSRGEYRFSLKAANGEIIATSEGYKQKAACLKGISSVRKNAAVAVIAEKQGK